MVYIPEQDPLTNQHVCVNCNAPVLVYIPEWKDNVGRVYKVDKPACTRCVRQRVGTPVVPFLIESNSLSLKKNQINT